MLHALAILIAVELLIRWVPLPRLSRLLGVRLDLLPVDADNARPRPALPLPSRRRLHIAYRIAELWPFRDGPCLRRSLVAAHLLRCHDASIRLGVAGQSESLKAHA